MCDMTRFSGTWCVFMCKLNWLVSMCNVYDNNSIKWCECSVESILDFRSKVEGLEFRAWRLGVSRSNMRDILGYINTMMQMFNEQFHGSWLVTFHSFHVHVFIHMYMYKYTRREREGKKQRQNERERKRERERWLFYIDIWPFAWDSELFRQHRSGNRGLLCVDQGLVCWVSELFRENRSNLWSNVERQERERLKEK